jgi:glycosyltransferase involved in cell wall biosynthesis
MNMRIMPTVSAIIPVHDGGDKFKQCVNSLVRAVPPCDEIIVVADGESDGSWQYAKQFDIGVIKIDLAGGPARARNIGAQKARGDIFFFVDADVAIPENAVGIVKAFFTQCPDVSAIMGSYDDSPSEMNFLSQYKNLFHHFIHQTANVEAATFWTGCGAIRREAFMAMGGFNEIYRKPSIEDIELGVRLKNAGHRIRIVRELQVKHLKRWDLMSLLRADVLYRAIPWTRLILDQAKVPNDLNLKTGARISAVLVCSLILCLAASFVMPWLGVPAILSVAGLVFFNRTTYRFFREKKGITFTLMVIPWHWLYFFYGGIAFSIGLVCHGMKKITG